MRERPECCICKEAITSQEKKTLKCKHSFHKDCIIKAYEYSEGNGACPVCREPYKLRVSSSNVERMQEIHEEREQEDIQEIISDDERFNRNIDEICVKFVNLFQEAEAYLPLNRNNMVMAALRSEVLQQLTSQYR